MAPRRAVRRAFVLAVLSLLVLVGCGDHTGAGAGDTGGGDGGGTPGGLADDLFVEVTVGGGLVPMGFDLRAVPQVVVYADGTVVVPGAVPAIYPGPAVTPLTTGRLDDSALADLVADARAGGLLDDGADVDLPEGQFVADAPTTIVRIVVDGEEHRLEAVALGLLPNETPTRAALSSFVQQASDAAMSVATEPYDAAAYRVQRIDGDLGDPSVQPNTVDWPAGVPEPLPDKCTDIAGDSATALESVLTEATDITLWRLADGTETVLAIRPVLPHETAC